MRAVVLRSHGGPEVLEVREAPRPEPARGEVRIRVHATAVNRADLLQRMGLYPAPPDAPADIPGLEYAGVVDALGEGVTDWAVGDRVFGLVSGGAYAEYVTTHGRTLAPVPEGLSLVEAAAIPEAYLTAYDALVTQGGLAAGQSVLIHAVGSGVGTAALQIARTLGLRCIGTSRSESKLARARQLGLDEGIHVTDGRFAEAVMGLTQSAGVDGILELVGGAYLAEDIACAASKAWILLVGLVGGGQTAVDLSTILRKRLTLRGTVLRSRPIEEKIAAAQVFRRHIVPLVDAGALKPIVDRVMRLEEVASAHALLAKNDAFGKIVLTL